MHRANRVEPFPVDTGSVKYAMVTITTQLDFLRQVEVTPNEGMVETPSYLQQLPYAITEQGRKALCFIGCLFITAGILALAVVITSLIILFTKMNRIVESDVERYDLGDLQYGLNNLHRVNFAAHDHLSDLNRLLVQKYFSDQLLNESGYRGLAIDGVFIRKKSFRYARDQRDSACSIVFVVQNLQIFFDSCSTCTRERHRVLHRSFFNVTALREPIHLILNNANVYAHICSTPPPPRSIVCQRLNGSYAQKTKFNASVAPTHHKVVSSRRETSTTHASRKFRETTTIPLRDIPDSLSTDISTETTEASVTVTVTQFDLPITSIHLRNTTPSLTSKKPGITSQQSSVSMKSSFRTTALSMFQFLPFRPATVSSFQRNTLSKRSMEGQQADQQSRTTSAMYHPSNQ